jgi:hypothetical protein
MADASIAAMDELHKRSFAAFAVAGEAVINAPINTAN